MLNQNQTQNQSSFQQYQQDQPRNPFPKSQRKDSNSNIPMNSKYSSNKPYQPRNNSSNRERSRSREISPRQSYHNYPQGNSGQNNNYNNRNNKPYHYRQNNDKQFDININKRENNFSWGYNNNGYNPSRDDCLIIFQKNYFNFNSKDFLDLKNELKRELKEDIYNIYYNESIPGIPDKIFRFTTNPSVNYPCKSKAIKIIADFLFDIMKHQNDKVTYLKLIFVIPENVIGFIIGISGKNINQIRDETNTKIEVFTPNNTKNYRKIEIAGSPQNIADAGEKICEITRKYFNFYNEKILNRNTHSPPQREQNYERERNRDQYGIDNFRERNRDKNERYHDGYWNRDYNNNNNKDFRGIYNRDRNDFRDMGYKNDFRNREGFRNYGGRDMRNNNYNNRDNNNYRDYRDKSPRYKNNNYDKGNNNRYYNDKNNDNNFNNDKNNNDSKNIDNYSNRSFSRKSPSQYSNENRSYNNKDNNNDEWPEDKDYKKDDNKNEEGLIQEQHSENNQNLEPGEAKDSDIDNNNNNNNENSNINNIISNEIKAYNENNIEVSNIENNNLESNINIENKEEVQKDEMDEINSILAKEEEQNDKLCKINIYLSSEEINLLNNSKNENDNIWINLENSFQCSISKIKKFIDEKEISLITFNGTPKQNTLAIYQLQKYLLETKCEKTG